MNLDYLMLYISRQLHTIVRRYTAKGELINQICERMGFSDDWDGKTEAVLQSSVPGCPVILKDSNSIAYVSAVTEHGIFVIGPVRLPDTPCRHRLPDSPGAPASWLSSVYSCTPDCLIREALLIYNLFSERVLTLNEVFSYNYLEATTQFDVQKDFTELVFQNLENTTSHNPYDQEIREFTSIAEGNPEHLKKSWEEDYVGTIGILAKDPLRHCKNLGIVLVVLAARAAIRGGVIPEIAFSLSDSYINKIEETESPEAAISTGRQAEYQYTLLVKDEKERQAASAQKYEPDPRIVKCKDYIFTHLHDKVSTSDIAAELLLNAGYLSELFKKEEGITISEYILQEKLKLVKNMLIYSRYSYSEIASYLGFSSQSYLGARFKKATGLTLHQYRERYGVKEFNL